MTNKLLFFGELPPRTIHGASLSNSLNLEQLSEIFEIYVVEEFSDLMYFNSFSFSKLYSFSRKMFLLLNYALRHKFHCFYGVIYLSTIGIFKNLISVCLFKIFNPLGQVILHFHRSDFDKFYSKYINRCFFLFLEKLVDKFIVLSDYQKDNFTSLKQRKLYVLYNTIEREFNRRELKLEMRQHSRDISVVYIGNYMIEKGVIELINSIKILNFVNQLNFKLDLYGNYTSESIITKLRDLVMGDLNISLNGPILGLDKFNKIFNADVVILPSYNEGLPLVLLESIYVGKPIIISKVGYIEEVLGVDYELYCEPRSVDSLILAFERFVKIDNQNIATNFIGLWNKQFSHSLHKKKLHEIFLHA
jgi:glycosyltransferase involved in cell wall biosynthesis